MQTLKLKFIEPEKNPPEKKKRAPASYIRKSFCVNGDVKKAELYITALGVYIGYLNGERLDNQVLLPGYTDYKHRVQYQSYDITDKLRQGENVIGAVVGDGWYRGSVGIGSKINCYGTKTKFACRFEITYADGRKDTIDSDDSFRVTSDGALRENDLKIREVYDATKELSGWNNIGFDDSAWGYAVSAEYNGEVVSSDGKEAARYTRKTPEDAVKLVLTPDYNSIVADGSDFTSVRIDLVDGNGTILPYADNEVSISVSGNGKFIGEEKIKLEGGSSAFFVMSEYMETGKVV